MTPQGARRSTTGFFLYNLRFILKHDRPSLVPFGLFCLAVAVSCVFACTAVQAAGERVTGANIKAALDSQNKFSNGFVTGYIAGVFDATVGVYHCTPASLKADEIVRIASARLTKNDEADKLDLLSANADVFVVRPFIEAYPCGRQAPEPAPAPVNPRDGSKS